MRLANELGDRRIASRTADALLLSTPVDRGRGRGAAEERRKKVVRHRRPRNPTGTAGSRSRAYSRCPRPASPVERSTAASGRSRACPPSSLLPSDPPPPSDRRLRTCRAETRRWHLPCSSVRGRPRSCRARQTTLTVVGWPFSERTDLQLNRLQHVSCSRYKQKTERETKKRREKKIPALRT